MTEPDLTILDKTGTPKWLSEEGMKEVYPGLCTRQIVLARCADERRPPDHQVEKTPLRPFGY